MIGYEPATGSCNHGESVDPRCTKPKAVFSSAATLDKLMRCTRYAMFRLHLIGQSAVHPLFGKRSLPYHLLPCCLQFKLSKEYGDLEASPLYMFSGVCGSRSAATRGLAADAP
jgi:hypothetical protein